MKFRLKASKHIQADPDWKPSEEERRMADLRALPLKAPSRIYSRGDLVESDIDLVERFGSEKFERVGERRRRRDAVTPGMPSDEALEKTPAVFSGGQVSTGHQHSTSTEEGVTISGPISAKELEERGMPTGSEIEDEDEEDEDESAPRTRTPARTPAEAVQSPRRPLPDNLDRMPLRELHAFATEEEIDLKGISKREDVIKAIRASRS